MAEGPLGHSPVVDRFIRGGIAAVIISGLLLAAGAFLQLLPTGHQQFSDQVVTGMFAVSSALRFTGAVLMTWGIVSLYLAQADRAGRLGLIAVVACLANMALQAGWMFADLFAAPSFAAAAPQVLNGDTPGRLALGFTVAWLANVSFVLLGLASLRARVLPKTCGIALIVAGAITLVPLPVDGPAFEVIIGTAFAVAGARALAGRTRAPLAARSARASLQDANSFRTPITTPP